MSKWTTGGGGHKSPSVKVGKPAAMTQSVHCPHCHKSFQLPISVGKSNGKRKGSAAGSFILAVLVITAVVVGLALLASMAV